MTAEGATDALRKFHEARLAGAKMIDVGCMQINHRFHGQHFASLEAMLKDTLGAVHDAFDRLVA